ncbi:acyltransferase [Luteolibacter flavescens]|uniref:Acyltransferase n=1 Tax=Luteolibacter flavescens TaxID=1859460 RepID=A0ABT3FNM8_9BACT|nr:acyltransferase [Luteolibacter flavescens]MCW1885180.1 acyltransferase [Luteolibacter flavescens]
MSPAASPSRSTLRDPALDVLRVVAMICVMMVHTPKGVDGVTTFLKHYMATAGVPAFFILSGYLSARKIADRDHRPRDFFREKFRTLIVPYLIWNVLVLAAILILKTFIPGTDSLGNGNYFGVDFEPWSMTCAIFGIGRSPIVYQFWFLRDLIIVSFIAFFLCRALPQASIIGWLLLLIPLPFVPSLGLFLVGISIGGRQSLTDRWDLGKSLIFGAGWIAVGIAATNGLLSIPSAAYQIFGTVFLYSLSTLVSRGPGGGHIATWGPMTFLAFAIHEPLQTIIFKVWEKLAWPRFGTVITNLLVPLLIFAVSLGIYHLMRRISPKLLLLLTGGR